MPKVSVIIPCYNVEEYLKRCLESIVNQTLQDIEIICINDGSTDNSLKILEEYSEIDNRIVLINQRNQGVSVARNIGIEKAKGKYLMFVDADDWLDLNALEILYEEISNSHCDVVNFGLYEYFSSNNIVCHWTNNLLSGNFANLQITKKILVNFVCWNKIYDTNFIQKNPLARFPENIKISEDSIFAIVVYLLGARIQNLNQTLYYYNKSNINSITYNPKNAIAGDLEGLKYLHGLPLFNNSDLETRYAIINKWLGTSYWYKKHFSKINYTKQIKELFEYLHSMYPKKDLKKLPNYRYLSRTGWYTFMQKIFSLKNDNSKHKVLTVFGIKLKFKRKAKFKINTGKLKYLSDDDITSDTKDNINVVFGVDDNYIQQLGVAITSILLNSKKQSYFHFYVLNTGLKAKNKKKLESLQKIRNFDISYLDVSNCDFSKFPLNRNWISVATYYRLFLSDVMPNNIDKCIYMDCDMLAEDDLAELWNYDISDYLAGVVEDESSKTNILNLGLPLENNYFNAGMIVFNLKNIRKFNFIEKASKYFKENKDKIKLQDQDILNGTLNGNCLFLPLKWNVNTPAYMREENNHFYSRREEEHAICNPGIIHFTGAYKPWLTSSCHPLRREYQKYLNYTNFGKDIGWYKFKEFLSKLCCTKENWNKKEVYILGLLIYKKHGSNSFLEELFSVKNSHDKKHKVITILGLKIKIARR